MVASIVRRPWYRFRANGAQVELAADPVQNEALEGVITTVLDVELASEITLATNVTADLYAVEQDAATITAQFGGRVNQIPADSFPNRVGYLCTGPLARLRRVTVSGRNLTGMTDGEAVQEILDSCNVTFDPADIQDAGYVLGDQTAVHWVKDQPGHEIIAELDRVFGMATIEVGAGRVVRFAYDRAPDDADIGVTYTRGVDAEFWRNSRTRGDLDAIINVVPVTGASWEDAAGCTRTPWAKGVADNADLGTGVRNRSMPFSSDLIQDEALAEAVATRLLRWYNRQPDTLTLVALNDPNVNCGDVIGVKDQAYGITLTAVATATPYLVLTIARRGDEMTLTCVGGAAGATGTITTGVEKVCNQTSSDVNIPGLFDPPAIAVPPAITIGAYDCATDGGPNGVCPDEGGGGGGGDLLAIVGCWVTDEATVTASTSDLVLAAGTTSLSPAISYQGAAHNDCHEIATGASWTLTFTAEFDTDDNSLEFGVTDDASGGVFAGGLLYGNGDQSVGATDYAFIDVYGWGGASDTVLVAPGSGWDTSPIGVTASYDAGTDTITVAADDGTRSGSISVAYDASPAAPQYVGFKAYRNNHGAIASGSVTVTNINLEIG